MKSSLLLVAFISKLLLVTTQDVNISLCVLQDKLSACNEINSKVPNFPVQCIPARDKIDCMHKVKEGIANVVNLGGNEAYVAGQPDFQLIPLLEERVNTGNFMYEGVAVMRKNSKISSLSDLKGKKSCHTGYSRTAGWDIPIALLMAKQIFHPEDNCGNDLVLASGLFSESCLPGIWSQDQQLHKSLKKTYSNLCKLCSQQCNLNVTEPYTGYEGALQCLVEKSADIAFTKYNAVTDYMKKNASFNQNYQLLCSDGSSSNLSSNCYWAARPYPLLMVHKDLTIDFRTKLASLIQEFFQQAPQPIRSSYLKGTLLSQGDSLELRNVSTKDVAEYLAKGNFQITMDRVLPKNCKETYTRLCVISSTEKQKCQDMKSAAFATRLRPRIACIEKNKEEECFDAIQDNVADIRISSALGLFIGTKKYDLQSILAETFPNRSFSHYAIAIVKSDSGINAMKDLRGRKACFPSVSDPAGWNVPIATLMKEKLIDLEQCSLNKKVSQFFSDSCAPGSSSPSLCKLCKGDKNGKKICSHDDQYGGHLGALKCLAEEGDVAFVSHTSIDQLIANLGDHRKLLEEFKNLTLRLLCPNGELKFINETEQCNWGRIPGRQVLTSKAKSDAEIVNMKMMLVKAASRFSSTSSLFKMFSSYNDKYDIVFTTEANGLHIQADSTEGILGRELQSNFESTVCENNSSLTKVTSWWAIGCLIFISVSRKFF